MNFVGFEEMRGQGAPDLLFNQVFIEPTVRRPPGRAPTPQRDSFPDNNRT